MVATDSTLRVPTHPSVFALGDTASAEERSGGAGALDAGGPFPATAQARCPQMCDDAKAQGLAAVLLGGRCVP